MGNENCPGCTSADECYTECAYDKNEIREFENIVSWDECKSQCLLLGDDYTINFNTMHENRACAIFSKNNLGKCICIKGGELGLGCIDIDASLHGCPNCATATECLLECATDHRVKFTGIIDWGECQTKCNSLGGDFAYEFDTWPRQSDRACAVYADYDDLGNTGLCVCVKGNNNACTTDVDVNVNLKDGYAPFAALPEIPGIPASDAISFDLAEGYEVGVISTAVILVIGLLIAYFCGKWKNMSKQQIKVDYGDSEDETIEYSEVNE